MIRPSDMTSQAISLTFMVYNSLFSYIVHPHVPITASLWTSPSLQRIYAL